MSTPSNPEMEYTADLLRFEIRDGIRRITCAVSNEALEAVSDLPPSSGTMLRRRSFDRFRTLIQAAAMLRLQELPAGVLGPIVLTSRDLRRVPPEHGMPAFGNPGRAHGRHAAPSAPIPVVHQFAAPHSGDPMRGPGPTTT